jgi:CO/xanthine dehydrogenase FAD-binding subunit
MRDPGRARRERGIPLIDFHRLPGNEPQRDTLLEPGEQFTAVDVPPLALAPRSCYRTAGYRAFMPRLELAGRSQRMAGDAA